jgi:hypothetical protein
MKKIICLLLAMGPLSTLLGCAIGGQPAANAYVEATYGVGTQNIGIGNADPNVQLYISNADSVCPNQQNWSQSPKTLGDGIAPFAPPCGTIDVNLQRVTSTNCPSYDTLSAYGQDVWVYNPFEITVNNSPPVYLPCGEVNTQVRVSPVSFASNQIVEVTLQTSPDAFVDPANSEGPTYTVVYVTDPTGSTSTPITPDSVSSDGSTLTFSTSTLQNGNGIVPMGNYVIAVMNVTPLNAVDPNTGQPAPPRQAGIAGGQINVAAPYNKPPPRNPPPTCTRAGCPA